MMLRLDAARKVALTLGAILLLVLAQGSPARADILSVSADLPVAMSVTVKASGSPTTTYDATSVTGLALGAALPIFPVGLGFENYTGKFSKSGTSFTYAVTMYDLFFNLPIPVVNVALGVGAGSASFGSLEVNGMSLPSVYNDANLFQWFASLGYSIIPAVDVHVGYHAFSGTNTAKSSAATQFGTTDAHVDGDMWSLGVKVGF